MTSMARPRWADYLLLALLAIAWGAAFTFIKITVGYISPVLLAASRIALGAFCLTLYAYWRGYQWPRGLNVWVRIFFLGLTGNALPFFLIAWGEQHIDSGLAAILMGTIPLLVMVIAHFTSSEKWHANQALAVALGFAGIITLVGWQPLSGIGDSITGQLAVFGGAISYALFGVSAKKLPPMPTEMSVTAILLAATFLILPVTFFVPGTYDIIFAWEWIFGLSFLGLVSTAGGALLYMIILKRTSAQFASMNNYLVPVVGLVCGILTLEERPGWNSFAALILILLGLAVPRLPWLRPKVA